MPSEITTHTGGISTGRLLWDINRKRRIRRMRRVVITGATVAREWLETSRSRYFACLVTLTYRSGVPWDASQIRQFITRCRDYARERGVRLRYQWVIELTQRGIPHYHVVFWMPHGFRLPKPDSSGFWPFGMSNIKRARKPVGYLVKYATKGSTAVYSLPKGARLFGVGGGIESEKLATHRAGLPMWLLEHLSSDAGARKVPHCGWVCKLSGEVFKSPFSVSWWRDEWGVAVVCVVKNLGVDYAFEDQDRGRNGDAADDTGAGWWRELPSQVADRDFVRWQVRLSAECAAWS